MGKPCLWPTLSCKLVVVSKSAAMSPRVMTARLSRAWNRPGLPAAALLVTTRPATPPADSFRRTERPPVTAIQSKQNVCHPPVRPPLYALGTLLEFLSPRAPPGPSGPPRRTIPATSIREGTP